MGAPLPGRAAPSSTRPGSRAHGGSQQRQRQRCQPCAAGSKAQEEAPPTSPQQQPEAAAPRLSLLQQVGRAAACAAAAAVLAVGALPPPAEAVLANPRAPVARTADVALRRSIPAFNAEVAAVQERLEAVAFKLRIPQRKPWASMGSDVAAAAAAAADRQAMLSGVLPPDAEAAEQLLTDIQTTLGRLERAIEVKDPSRTSIRVSNALEQVASLELLQAPGLPYQLPRQLAAAYPSLVGRAVVELTVEKAGGERAFVDPNSGGGPQKQATLRLVLDGYSAPITAANFVANVQAGLYRNAEISVSGSTVLAGPPSTAAAAPADADGAAAGDGADGEAASAAPSSSGRKGGRPAALPLEILAAGDFEPVYRSTLDVRNGELPVLPLSIYGAIAMARLPDAGASGYVSSTQFFMFKFDRQQAGLAGLSFDEGEFGVCGYVVKGLDALEKLASGDRIVKAEVVSGLDKVAAPS